MPHPVPYQGSKRRLAPAILSLAGQGYERFIEPFAGSAALTLAAAARGHARSFVVGEAYAPLAALWQAVVERPGEIGAGYEALWRAQHDDEAHFERVRDAFNEGGDPVRLLYLLSRCVKAAVRFNRAGAFNQAPDRRRTGARPARVAREISAAHALLSRRTRVLSADASETIADARPGDFVYLDPPYEGTSVGRDRRYAQGFDRARLVAIIDGLVRRGVDFVVSYDGRRGDTVYGEPLPASLGLVRRELDAGPSSQATLLGRRERTIETLYLAPTLAARPC